MFVACQQSHTKRWCGGGGKRGILSLQKSELYKGKKSHVHTARNWRRGEGEFVEAASHLVSTLDALNKTLLQQEASSLRSAESIRIRKAPGKVLLCVTFFNCVASVSPGVFRFLEKKALALQWKRHMG